jgi:hypothetical protein
METKGHTEDELKKRILLLVEDYYKLMRRRNTQRGKAYAKEKRRYVTRSK